MARIPTYTAELGIPAGGTGPQASPAAFAAPARALAGLGETVAQTGAQVARAGSVLAERTFKLEDLKKERREQDDAFWAAGENERFQEKLIEFYNQNKTDEELGEKYKTYADGLAQELESAAPTPNAAKRFRLAAARTFNTGYGTALNTGESVRLANTISSVKDSTARIASIMEASVNPEEHLVLVDDRIAAIDSISWLSDSSKRSIRQSMLSDIAVRISTAHTQFARDLIDGNSDIDADKQQEILQKLDSIERAKFVSARLDYDQQWESIKGAALVDGRRIDLPPFEHLEKSFLSKEEQARWVKDKLLERDLVNANVDVFSGTMHLSPAYRAAIVSDRLSKYDGAIRPKVKAMVDERNRAINKALEEDPAGVIQASDPDLKAMETARQAYAKTPGSEQEARLMQQAIFKRRWMVQGVYDPDNEDHKKLDPSLFHNMPQSEQRLLTRSEAVGYFNAMKQGSWEQRLKAVQSLKYTMGSDRLFAVAAKDIEQMNPGETDMIQKLMVSSKLLDSGRKDLVSMLFTPDSTAAQFANDPKNEVSKKLRERLQLDNSGDIRWRTFAKAVRGSDEYGADMVNGFRETLLLAAASMLTSSTKAASSPADAVKKAYDTVIAPLLEVTEVPSYEMGGGYPIAIARDRMNPSTGNIDPMLGKRSEVDARAIAHGLGRYVLDRVDPKTINLVDRDKDPLYMDVVESAYKMKDPATGTMDETSAKTLHRFLHQNAVWVPTPDMQSAVLYVVGKSGRMFAPTFKGGGHISVNYSELESAFIPPFVPEYQFLPP
jgi:hypothetical protein